MPHRNYGTFLAVIALSGAYSLAVAAPARAQQTAPPPGNETLFYLPPGETSPVHEAHLKKVRDLIEQGRVLYKAGKLPEAAKVFEEALHLNKSSGSVFHELSDIYEKQARWNDAVKLYQPLVNLQKSNDYEKLFKYALVLTKAKRIEEAVQAYHQGLQHLPQTEDQGFYVPLQKRFNNTSYVPAPRLEAAIETALGMIDHWQGYYPQAIPHLRRAISLYPTFATPHFYLGASLRYSLDKTIQADAEKSFQRAIDLGGSEVQASVKKLKAAP